MQLIQHATLFKPGNMHRALNAACDSVAHTAWGALPATLLRRCAAASSVCCCAYRVLACMMQSRSVKPSTGGAAAVGGRAQARGGGGWVGGSVPPERGTPCVVRPETATWYPCRAAGHAGMCPACHTQSHSAPHRPRQCACTGSKLRGVSLPRTRRRLRRPAVLVRDEALMQSARPVDVANAYGQRANSKRVYAVQLRLCGLSGVGGDGTAPFLNVPVYTEKSAYVRVPWP